MISDRRRRLGPDIIQAVQCLRQWWRCGMISDKREEHTYNEADEDKEGVDDEMNKAIARSLAD